MSRASDDARDVDAGFDPGTLARTRGQRRASDRKGMDPVQRAHRRGSTLLTVRQVAERYPAFSEAGIRWALFCARAPEGTRAHEIYAGLLPAIVRIGRRVLIDEPRFLRWAREAVH